MIIRAVGGFSEVGKNMVVAEFKEDAFIFDEGFFLPSIVKLEERERINYTEKKLREIGALPSDEVIYDIKHKVRAQIIGHAHLDHVGAVPFLSNHYNAPIYGTPFTNEVLHSLNDDNQIILKNKIKTIQPNSSFEIQGLRKRYSVDFVNMTHSTPQTSLVALHSEEGSFVYANDFKLDDTPIFGLKPNYEKMKEISRRGVKAFVVDSLYSGYDRKTPSERIARHLLEEVMLGIDKKNSAIFVTTFSSHIARLKSIVDFAEKLNRQVVFLGRSLDKYCKAAKESGLGAFLKRVKICSYPRQVEKELKQIERKRGDYVVVCTGHQGEPGSVLEKISRGQFYFNFKEGDNLIFSSSVIPIDVNKENFLRMEERFKKKKVRIFKDVHVSGHGSREDLRDLINIINPENLIPAHGDESKTKPAFELAEEMGYSKKQIHLLNNGISLRI